MADPVVTLKDKAKEAVEKLENIERAQRGFFTAHPNLKTEVDKAITLGKAIARSDEKNVKDNVVAFNDVMGEQGALRRHLVGEVRKMYGSRPQKDDPAGQARLQTYEELTKAITGINNDITRQAAAEGIYGAQPLTPARTPTRIVQSGKGDLSQQIESLRSGHPEFFQRFPELNGRVDAIKDTIKGVQARPNINNVGMLHNQMEELAARIGNIADSGGARLNPEAGRKLREEALAIKTEIMAAIGAVNSTPGLQKPDPTRGGGRRGPDSVMRQEETIPKSGPPQSQKVTPEIEALRDVQNNLRMIDRYPQVALRVAAPMRVMKETVDRMLKNTTGNYDPKDVATLHKSIQEAKDKTLEGPRSDATVRGYLEQSRQRLNNNPKLKENLGALNLPADLPKLQGVAATNVEGPSATPAHTSKDKGLNV
jgi:hypothetical protein